MTLETATPPGPGPSPSEASSTSPKPPTGWHPVAMGLASGLLLFLAYEPVGAWWLAWVALVPFLRLVRSDRSAGAVYLGAWIGGLAFWLAALEWVRTSDESAWPGWLAMAAALSIWWPAALGMIRAMVRRLGLPLMLAAPAVWVALEFFRAHYPFNGFHWFYLAHSQQPFLPLIQVSDLAGAWTLSILVAMVNAWLVDLIELPRLQSTPRGPGPTRPHAIRLVIVIVAIGGSLIYGAVRLATADFKPGPRLALLQTDIPQEFSAPPDPAEVVHTFGRLTEQAMADPDRPDLIVWPETMYPYSWVEIDPALSGAEFSKQVRSIHPDSRPDFWTERAEVVPPVLHRWADRLGVPMLVGINSYHFRPSGLSRYNTALLLKPGSKTTQAYHKLHLVPFGEYVPLVRSLPFVLAFTPFDASNMPGLDPGSSPSALELGRWRLAVAICFEDSVPQVARSLVAESGDRPADLLLNLSNDGWFRGTAAHELHLDNSVLRAVELRVPVARAVNTGTSAVINGNGVVLDALPPVSGPPPASEGLLTVDVPLDPRTSLYAITGDWLPMACLLLVVLAVPMAVIRSRRSDG